MSPASPAETPAAAPARAVPANAERVASVDALRGLVITLMIFVNEAIGWETKPVSVLRDFLILLAPYSPHLSEELWDKTHAAFGLPNEAFGFLQAALRSYLLQRDPRLFHHGQ